MTLRHAIPLPFWVPTWSRSQMLSVLGHGPGLLNGPGGWPVLSLKISAGTNGHRASETLVLV